VSLVPSRQGAAGSHVIDFVTAVGHHSIDLVGVLMIGIFSWFRARISTRTRRSSSSSPTRKAASCVRGSATLLDKKLSTPSGRDGIFVRCDRDRGGLGAFEGVGAGGASRCRWC